MRRSLVLLTLIFATAVAALSPARPALAAECEVHSNPNGGAVSVCPEATTLDDFLEGLTVAWNNLVSLFQTGTLSITSDPAGSTVSVDGIIVGQTPLQVPVRPGSHTVRVQRPGYVAQSVVVSVQADETAEASLSLIESTTAVSYLWQRAPSFLSLGAFEADGSFTISDFVIDKDGNYYVTFHNGSVPFVLEFGGLDDDAPFGIQDRVITSRTHQGVAMSTDKGQSWSLLLELHNVYEISGRTSKEFIDSRFQQAKDSSGNPTGPREHTAKIYYTDRHFVNHAIRHVVPREDGGVIIRYTTVTVDAPRQIERAWDNLRTIRESYQFSGTPVPAGYDLSISAETASRWGASVEDFTSGTRVSETQEFVMSPGNFGPRQVNLALPSGMALPSYEGSFENKHYFLSFSQGPNPVPTKRYVLMSDNDLQSWRVVAEYDPGFQPAPTIREDIRVDNEGNLYVLDHLKGTLHSLKDGKYELVGRIPEDINSGVAGGNNIPHLVGDFDNAGNFHMVFRRSITPENNSQLELYYQFIPANKPRIDSVSVFTGPDCDGCQELTDFLTSAGVAFRENPQLAAGQMARMQTVAAETGYPVIGRQTGDEFLFFDGSDAVDVSRLLGISYPRLVTTYNPRAAAAAGSLRLFAQWVWLYIEGNSPRILADTSEGVQIFSTGNGGWSEKKLFDSPPGITDLPNVTYSKWYPFFPGSRSSVGSMTVRDVLHNSIESEDDIVFLYYSAIAQRTVPVGSTTERVDVRSYTLHMTDMPEQQELTGDRVILPASQLLPGAVFYVPLKEGETSTAVMGELAAYVVEQGDVTEGGERFYRVKVDLRANGETAVNGHIQPRMIGGRVEVTGGVDENDKPLDGTVSLFLSVDNSRLVVFHSDSLLNTRDLSMEAVRFENGRWVIVNNLAIPNSIQCSDGSAITVDANSYFTLDTSPGEYDDLAGCLAGVETTPLQVPDCTTWADAQAVLGAELLAAYASSLPLYLDENGLTNYEQFFGHTDFTAHRVVNVDNFRAPGSGPACLSEVDDAPAVVVKVSGDFIANGDENYAPSVSTVFEGTVPVSPQPAPGKMTIDQETAWLEFEAEFLEAGLAMVANEGTARRLFGAAGARKIRYRRELVATRALLHCVKTGHSISSIVQFNEKTAEFPEAIRPAVAGCVQDFLLNPTQFWPTYGRFNWNGLEVGFVKDVLKFGMAENPTLAYLVSRAKGEDESYDTFVIARAQHLQTQGDPGDPARLFPIDLALDHYARVRTRLMRDRADQEMVLQHFALFLDPAQREIFSGPMATCLSGMMGSAAPLSRSLELTPPGREFNTEIPCVAAQANNAARAKIYMQFGVGLRSDTFVELIKLSNNNLDDLMKNLRLLERAIPAAVALEQRHGNLQTINIESWRGETLSPIEKVVMLHQKTKSLAESMSNTVNTIEGFNQCVDGLVQGLFTYESAAFFVTTGVAILAAPATGGASVAFAFPVMAGVGMGLAAQGVYDLSQQWERLSETEQVAGACQVTVGALMAFSGARAAKPAFMEFNAAQVKLSPPKKIDIRALPQQARATGRSLVDRFTRVRPKGETVTPPPRPASTGPANLQALLRDLPEPRRIEVIGLADAFGYSDLAAGNPARAVFEAMVNEMKQGSNTLQRLRDLRNQRMGQLRQAGQEATPEYAAWDRSGAAFMVQLSVFRDMPKSIRVFARDGVLQGADAPFVEAILRDGWSIDRRNPVLLGYLNSDRVVRAIKDPTGRTQVYTLAERNALANFIKQVRGTALDTVDRAFFAELTGETRIVSAMNEAIRNEAAAQGVALGDGLSVVQGVTFTKLATGAFKVVNKVEVRIAGRSQPLEMVLKKGEIPPQEFQLLQELGDLGITQKPLISQLIDNVDTTGRTVSGQNLQIANAISIEEFVPGLRAAELDSLSTPNAAVSRAIGELDADLLLATLKDRPEGRVAYYNRDLHLNNIHIIEEGGTVQAKIVDFDGTSTFFKLLTEEQYMYSTMVRRLALRNIDASGAFGPRQTVTGLTSYLEGFVSAFEQTPGRTRAQAIQLLRETSSNLRQEGAAARLMPAEDVGFVGSGAAREAGGPLLADSLDAAIATLENR